ncbi:MAG: hypothetical protein LUQ25_01505 [Methanoregulaceae archaeon]|nr:hypothetical protein [Methanoregulaceae archaeon]
MTGRVGLIWDTPLVFSRFIEECGFECEHISPQLLAAPFFRRSFSTLIVPAGFGNPSYSRLLPALRASTSRIRRFVEAGGNLLVYGPGLPGENTMDWLPFPIKFVHSPGVRRIECDATNPAASILKDYDESSMECDGYIDSPETVTVASSAGRPVLSTYLAGRGTVVVTSIHEYPSRSFIVHFCSAESETLL